MSLLKFPLILDPGILTVMEADGQNVCSDDLTPFENWHANRARRLRFMVAAANACRQFSTEALEALGEFDANAYVAQLLELSLEPKKYTGPVGLVR